MIFSGLNIGNRSVEIINIIHHNLTVESLWYSCSYREIFLLYRRGYKPIDIFTKKKLREWCKIDKNWEHYKNVISKSINNKNLDTPRPSKFAFSVTVLQAYFIFVLLIDHRTVDITFFFEK